MISGRRSGRTMVVAVLGATAVVLTGAATAVPTSAQATSIGFGKSVLAGETSTRPTVIQFGPDGRLYVAQQDGTIKRYTVARSAANSYQVTATQTINLVKTIPNHDDDGTLDTAYTTRQLTGMFVTGTATSPVLYVSSSDPRYGGGGRGDLNLDTNSGVVSRLTLTSTGWHKVDLVRGLPRSEENHAVNGLVLDPSTNTLYLAVGGNTNMGAPSKVFAYLPEYALSAAILSIDLNALGTLPYDLPTLNDLSRTGNPDPNDPFGGNDGANQAKIVPGGPVQVYSPGYRNPYDVMISSTGHMYATDNGNNSGQGDVPIGEGPGGTCTNDINEPGVTGPDSLHLIPGPGYYAGHPNPTRGNMSNTFGGQSPVTTANPQECDYLNPGTQNHALATDPSSSNGIAEYTASDFSGAMQGDLLVAEYDNYISRFELDSTGTTLLGQTTLFASVGTHPLDITTLGDDSPLKGTIWVADIGSSDIYVYEPNDFGGGGTTCTGAYNTTDEDGDGYTNADELDNNTDPCSAGDVPHDWDGDFVSDLNDPDDDNDGIPDTTDPFAIDPKNGMTTQLPAVYTFDDGTINPGGLLDLGFTGLMTNGTSNYASLYDPTKLTAGGAPGVLTVDGVTAGDALGSTNTQEYAFQFGAHVTSTSGPVVAETRLVAPFSGITPTGKESMGLQIGTGTQDNYLKLVLTANDGNPGVNLVEEVGGTPTSLGFVPLPVSDLQLLDLFINVDPATGAASASFIATTSTGPGASTAVGNPTSIPASWVSGTSALAVGVIATSSGGTPFPVSWDQLGITGSTRLQPDGTVKIVGQTSTIGDNIYNTTALNQTKTASPTAGTTKTFLMRFWNDGSVTDSVKLLGQPSSTGFTVTYYKGSSGTTDITSAVEAGTYGINNVAPGGSGVIRVAVTVAPTVTSGTIAKWLVLATSSGDPTKQDAVAARVKVG